MSTQKRGRPRVPKDRKRKPAAYRFTPETLLEMEEFAEQIRETYPQITKTKLIEVSLAYCRDLYDRGKLPLRKLLGQP